MAVQTTAAGLHHIYHPVHTFNSPRMGMCDTHRPPCKPGNACPPFPEPLVNGPSTSAPGLVAPVAAQTTTNEGRPKNYRYAPCTEGGVNRAAGGDSMVVGAMGEAMGVLERSEGAAHRLPGGVLLGDEPMTKEVFEQLPHRGSGGEHTGIRVPEVGVEAAKGGFLLEPVQTLHDPAAN
jgi:hypothetical protein